MRQLALRTWQVAQEVRRKDQANSEDIALIAVDGVPWEIHEIEDEEAYVIALTTYLRSKD